MHAHAKALLKTMIDPLIKTMAILGRPRILYLSNTSICMLNGLMLSVAGLSMMIPDPDHHLRQCPARAGHCLDFLGPLSARWFDAASRLFSYLACCCISHITLVGRGCRS